MKAIEKKLLASAIAASFLLGTAGVMTQAQAADNASGDEVRPTGTEQRAESSHIDGRADWHHKVNNVVAQTATILGVEQDVVKEALKQGKSLLQIAQDKGINEDTLMQKLIDAEKEALAAAVSSGKLTQEKADKISSGMEDRIRKQVHGTGWGKVFNVDRKHMHQGFAKHEVTLGHDTAEILGVTPEAVKESLKQGNTFAQIAQGHGLSEADYLQKLTDRHSQKLTAAVSAGRLTEEQAERIKSKISEHLQERINQANTKEFHLEKRGLAHAAKPEALAEAIGISEDQLKSGLQAGKSLSELAQEQGISEDQLIQKLKDGMTDQLRQFVQHKKDTVN
ncbi:hypothetical protein [Paenibacillus xerothermodurans]|uniref:LysM domain-containing protein n=1 Tax=Paenibacillus xerothermodurans TaxID=1977292 RepID=A0A2W1P4N3_PAEXE|nr:hypothetical protein [Paenibacillus xerothermodurans]PZE22108.1 hypothetical protein CBW46_006885 [Paenibacillus xerothermodurans]